MSRIPNFVNVSAEDVKNVKRGGNNFNDVELDSFLQLMVTELQNQDPLNPTDNSEIISQISQMRQIASSNQLIETLQGVLTGQSLGTASSLIGKKIEALTDTGENVVGVVESVSVSVNEKDDSRTYKLQIGSNRIDLKNVRSVLPNGASSSEEDATVAEENQPVAS